MPLDRIKDSHELADLLDLAVHALRAQPPVALATEETLDERNSRASSGKVNGRKMEQELNRLADRLPGFERTVAESELASMTVAAIRQLAPLLDIRLPSKAKKSEYIQILLGQLFDAPAGQELVRNFHKRNEKFLHKQSNALSSTSRPTPTGKIR